jgi:hypothetical protein
VFRRFLTGMLVLLPLVVAAGNDKRRDPTEPARWQPVAVEATGADAPTLMSILIGKDRKLVVIDGMLLEEGEEKNGLRVWRVSADQVLVSVAGRSPQTLRLDSQDMSKEAR